jgi:pyruvate dehydrogenase E2 component (dihydrolipoamide acetyltransferase)
MATNILMPALSPTMTEGTLARWLKAEGDTVKAGDIIAEIETDKATMEVEAVDEGILGKIMVAGGTAGVKVNDVIAVLVQPGESANRAPVAVAAPPAPVVATAPPAPVAAAVAAPVAGPMTAAVVAPSAPAPTAGDRIIASPLARRMAAQAGLDLAGVPGTGPNGRVVKADVEAALSKPKAAAPLPRAASVAPLPVEAPAAPKPAPKPAPLAIAAPHTAVPHSTMRRVIARRLSESKQHVPHFYVSMDIEIDALLKLRAQLNCTSPKEGPGAFKLSVNDLVIKAAAVALRRFPNVNAMWSDDAILQLHDVDISIAVSIPDGLITPIIKRADQKGLAAISNEMKDLAARAKTGKLKPDEFQGGGFSISNMGMYGVRDFAAIINPPQAGILAVGAGEARAVVKDGALAVATIMTCTLSVDHRVIDGALAAEFLQALKRIIEEPLSLML